MQSSLASGIWLTSHRIKQDGCLAGGTITPEASGDPVGRWPAPRLCAAISGGRTLLLGLVPARRVAILAQPFSAATAIVLTAGAALAAAAGSYRALFIILAAPSAFSAVLVRTATLSSRSPAENDVFPAPVSPSC